MQKIKVVHILNSINLGGGARAVRTLYKYSTKNLEIHIIAVFEKGEKYNEFSKVCNNLYFANADIKKIINYIKIHNIKIIHFHSRGVFTDFELSLAKNFKSKCKIVCTNIFGEFSPKTDDVVDYYIFKSFHAFTKKFAKNSKLDLLNYKNLSNRYYVIPNPIDIELFNSLKPTKKQIIQLKKKLGIRQNDFVIGKIGSRKAIEKWSDLLLYMFPYVLKKNPNTVMLLQGVPDSRLRWIRKFKGKVKVLPNTSDDKELALYYNLVDVFTHACKIGEHSGNSINEAMFWKKPVIVNLTPKKDNGQLEQVSHGVSGYFANNYKKYAKYVNTLLGNKEKLLRLGQNVHSHVLDLNNPRQFSKQHCSIYKSILGIKSLNTLKFNDMVSNYLKNYNSRLTKYYDDYILYSPIDYAKLVYYKFLDYYQHNYGE